MDKYIRVKNCNCISDATIEIVEKSLNIKYGSNGTGKSTISEAIYAQANNGTDRLKDLKPYGSNDNSQPTVDNPYFHVVKAFNEDYVNSYLFQGDEFLDDSFQVFLKSDKCDSLAAQIERMLEELQDLINNIDAIHNLRTFLPQYTAAVKASDGTVSRRGGVAEFVNGNGGGFNHYSELKAYKPFYSRDLPSVAKWAKWRNDGIKQMCGNDCPFCTNILPSSIRSQNEIISKVFKNSALSVANAVLEYVQQAVDQGYILPDAVDVLESYIGDNTKADELYAELQMLAKETDYLYKKIEKICMFKPMNVTHAQLVNLEQSLSELVIEERQLQSFYATDLIKKLIYHVSDKINALKGKTGQSYELLIDSLIKKNALEQIISSDVLDYEKFLMRYSAKRSKKIMDEIGVSSQKKYDNLRRESNKKKLLNSGTLLYNVADYSINKEYNNPSMGDIYVFTEARSKQRYAGMLISQECSTLIRLDKYPDNIKRKADELLLLLFDIVEIKEESINDYTKKLDNYIWPIKIDEKICLLKNIKRSMYIDPCILDLCGLNASGKAKIQFEEQSLEYKSVYSREFYRNFRQNIEKKIKDTIFRVLQTRGIETIEDAVNNMIISLAYGVEFKEDFELQRICKIDEKQTLHIIHEYLNDIAKIGLNVYPNLQDA